MTPEQLQQFNDLIQKVGELQAWKERREAQQIQNPLDSNSQEVVYKDVLLFRRIKPAVTTITPAGNIIVEINGKQYNLVYS